MVCRADKGSSYDGEEDEDRTEPVRSSLTRATREALAR